MRVRILRQVAPFSEPYWETFDYDGPDTNSIAGVLDYLNYKDDIRDIEGNPTTRIGWECSCMQGVCGACAMVINGVPALACNTMVKDLKSDEIEIRPLRKFVTIHDLVIDRTSILDNLKKMNMYIGEYNQGDAKNQEHQYNAAKCLKCGLCLEVCPNYVNGENFYGAVFANDCYLVASRNKEKSKEIKQKYKEHFGRGCSKALSCVDVCPMQIDGVKSMGKMNR